MWTTKQFQEKGHLYSLTRWGLPPTSQRWINQVWQPRLPSVIWPFWNWISFPHAIPFPAISCLSKMSSTKNCHRQVLTVEPEAYVGDYGKALYKIIFEKITCWGLSFYYLFLEKRKFTRCKSLTQYIIISDSSLYTLAHRPCLGQCWEEHGQHECIWDPSWTSRNEPQSERRTQWQMMLSPLVPKVSQDIIGINKTFLWGRCRCLPCRAQSLPGSTHFLPWTTATTESSNIPLVCVSSAGLFRFPISYFCLPFHDSVPDS